MLRNSQICYIPRIFKENIYDAGKYLNSYNK